MDFKDIEHVYKLDFNGLAEILKERRITLKLEHLNDIPEKWIPIIEESLGLRTPREDKKKINVSTSGNLDKRKNIKKKKEDDSNNKKEVPGSQTKKNHKQTNSENKRKKVKEKFYAFVKYIGPELDHAFIKRVDDINAISSIDMNVRDDLDFKIIDDCSTLELNQIILCEIKSKKRHLATIISEVHEGTISIGKSSQFTDWLSFDEPIIVSNVRTINFTSSDILVATTLHYRRNKISCTNLNLEVDNKAVISKIENKVVQSISKTTVHENINKLINLYKSEIDITTYNNTISEQFEIDVNDLQSSFNEQSLNIFLKKWKLIDSSLITHGKVYNEEFFISFFELWLTEELPINYWGESLIDACIKYESNVDKNNSPILHSKLQIKHIVAISAALETYLLNKTVVDNLIDFQVIKELLSLSNLEGKEDITNQLLRKLSPKLNFELWLNGEDGTFEKDIALKVFPKSNVEQQSQILEELTGDDILALLPSIKEVSNIKIEKKVFNALSTSILNKLEFICFDLESNGEIIKEIAWVTHKNGKNQSFKKRDLDSGLAVFAGFALVSSSIFVGHNIVEWDIPILSKFNIKIKQDQVWDTLLVETFLSPEFKNYALVTAHNAIDDAKLTKRLFLNQFWRILFLPDEKLKYLFLYLSDKIVDIIKKIKINLSTSFKPITLLNNEKATFFRPQPKPNVLIEKLKTKIETLSTTNILIIGSDSFKNEILTVENIKFHCNDASNKDLYRLDKTKISEIDDANLWENQVLLNYVEHNESISQSTYWGQLPTSVKIKVESNVSNMLELFHPIEEIEWSVENTIFFTIPELLLYRDQLSELKEITVVTVQNDLLSTENKKILKEVSLDFLMSEINNDDHIWLRFSGGQSFSLLTEEQCKTLEVEIPEPIDNVWIEKVTLNKFKIWGNFSWEDLLLTFDVGKIFDIQPDLASFKKEQTIIAHVSAVETLKNKVIRFNPESLYRSRYWVFQKQLVDQIVNNENASVLIIQNYDEIEILQNYFKHLKYYIPEKSISIGRRLELLHQSKSKFKLIIEHVSQLHRIVQANHVGSLNIILDSFNLTENYYSSHNSSYFKSLNTKRLRTINQVEDDDSENSIAKDGVLNTSKKPVISDTFFLLELLKPKISHIRNLIQYSNPNHKLWILDPRCNDFSSLYKSWNVSKRTLKTWKDSESYEAAVKEADMHIQSVKPVEDLPIDKERIKEILRQVFLKEFTWRSSQLPYLDLIIDGKENQLITLPTGEGKSVLFQGPALFKSAFTNRLTIVVTPLKALMEDQVDALWDKGFFGSVDYINSDRSSEVYSIYRAMAGGELSLLFVTPERFRSRSFNNALQLRIQSDGGLEYGVFDEAHCVSQWGHEFRPDYFNSAKRMVNLKKLSSNNFPLLLFSATVSQKIYHDFNTIFS